MSPITMYAGLAFGAVLCAASVYGLLNGILLLLLPCKWARSEWSLVPYFKRVTHLHPSNGEIRMLGGVVAYATAGLIQTLFGVHMNIRSGSSVEWIFLMACGAGMVYFGSLYLLHPLRFRMKTLGDWDDRLHQHLENNLWSRTVVRLAGVIWISVGAGVILAFW